MRRTSTRLDGRARPTFLLLLAALAALPLAGGADDQAGEGKEAGEHRRHALGLWGDLPYSDLQATVGVPNLIADMNGQELAFTVHDGDREVFSFQPQTVPANRVAVPAP